MYNIDDGAVVQRIGPRPSKSAIQVRFLSALPNTGSPVVGAEVKSKTSFGFFEGTRDGQLSEGELIPVGSTKYRFARRNSCRLYQIQVRPS